MLKSSRGFSLIELMIVVAVVACLALTSALGLVGSQSKIAGKEEALKLETILATARNEAQVKGKCVFVEVISTTSVRVNVFSPTSLCDVGSSLPETSKEVNFKAGTVLTPGTSNPIVFLPSGGTIHASAVTVELSPTESRSYQLTVFPAIGQVRVK